MASRYLTLAEAAERLGVEYKTIYNLVRNGDLPAGKVGRIYRIRPEDLDAFFDRQKQAVAEEARRTRPVALEDLKCGACGQRIVSEFSIGGRCPETDQPICQACWSIKKIRRCDVSPADLESPSTVQVRPIRPSSAVPPKPQVARPKPFALPDTPEETVVRLRAEGKLAATAEEAALAEKRFLRMLAQRLELLEEIRDPISGQWIELRSARVKHEIQVTESGDTDRPGNRISRFLIRTGGWGKPRACVCVEGHFLSDIEAFSRAGYQEGMLEEDRLEKLLGELAKPLAKSKCFRLAVLASPTGWSDKAVATVTGGTSHAFRSSQAATVLVDLRTNQMHFDESDDRLLSFLGVIAPDQWRERVSAAESEIRQRIQDGNSLSLRDAIEICDDDESSVRAAFRVLAADEALAVHDIPEIGRVVSKRTRRAGRGADQ
jgi:excisionase family DNA binding protein